MTNITTWCILSICVALSTLCLPGMYTVSNQSPSGCSGQTPAPVLDATSASPLDHRVILHPSRWKIRTPERRGAYFVYRFFLGFNWTELEVNYPQCPQVACRGLPHPYQGCDRHESHVPCALCFYHHVSDVFFILQ